jgi:hypothetical protein
VRQELALLDVLAGHQFGRDEGYSGHASDIVNWTKMTQTGASRPPITALQKAYPSVLLAA